MSVLEQLYNGNINPSEKYIKKGGDYEKSFDKLVRNFEELQTLLTTKQKQICEQLEENISRISYISEKESFIEGYRLGAKTVFEIIYYESKNYEK